MLGQAEIVKYFDQCEDMVAVDEVLSAYVTWKILRGMNSAQVLHKIHHLTIFLRVTGRGRILQIGADAIKAVTFEVAEVGGARMGVSPAVTKPGLAVWNLMRRAATKTKCGHLLFTDRMYGGPMAVQSMLAANNQPGSEPRYFYDQMADQNERPRWVDHFFFSRPQFGNMGAPDYASQAGEDVNTLPLYRSQGSRGLVESIVRTIHESEHDDQEDLNTHLVSSSALSPPAIHAL